MYSNKNKKTSKNVSLVYPFFLRDKRIKKQCKISSQMTSTNHDEFLDNRDDRKVIQDIFRIYLLITKGKI